MKAELAGMGIRRAAVMTLAQTGVMAAVGWNGQPGMGDGAGGSAQINVRHGMRARANSWEDLYRLGERATGVAHQ